jgi:hypothetical protein
VELVRDDCWDLSGKVCRALGDAEFTEDDLVRCVLEGKLHKRERDEWKEAVDGRKYTIWGPGSGGRPFYICGKILADDEGRCFFFITAHWRD